MIGAPSGSPPPPEIVRLAGGFGYADHYAVSSGKDIRLFLTDFFSYRPAWMHLLFSLRRPLARVLRISNSLESPGQLHAADIPFTPGERLRVFTVQAAEEDRYWAATAEDSHLKAVLAVIKEGAGDTRVFRVTTFVIFKNWRGRFYFALVKPFHRLIVSAMTRAAA